MGGKKYQPVIGLEIHVELATSSKMFCQCSSYYFGKPPNTQVCPVCLGLPGALPVPNKKAIEWTVLLGMALNCQINKISRFARKHYFYPDLPKGYQISQYDEPIAVNGFLKIKTLSQEKIFRIRRVHLEEDTGKLIHLGNETFIDFNRSGVPLIEIVTEPDFDNSDDVKRFLEELQVLIRYLGISDCDMEKGTMRLEPNISIIDIQKRISKQKLPSYKVEVKNINSFRFVKHAIDYEIKRQIEILENGKIPRQETRGFDEEKGITYSQREKEEAADYRYFPEPDIPPIIFYDEWLEEIKSQMGELPSQKLERYIKEFGLRYQEAFILTRDKKIACYFEKIVNKLLKGKNLEKIEKLSIGEKQIPQTVANLIVNKKISIDVSIDEFILVFLEKFKKKEFDEKKLNLFIEEVIKTNPKAVADYKKGKQNAIMFLVGQIMRKTKGEVEAKLVIEKLKEKLKN